MTVPFQTSNEQRTAKQGPDIASDYSLLGLPAHSSRLVRYNDVALVCLATHKQQGRCDELEAEPPVPVQTEADHLFDIVHESSRSCV